MCRSELEAVDVGVVWSEPVGEASSGDGDLAKDLMAKDDEPVFASKSGRPLGHRGATGRGFAVAAKEARLEGVSFHSMRHAFASRMIDRGISSTVLAKLMGHETSAITERRYIHLFDQVRTNDAVRQAMAR